MQVDAIRWLFAYDRWATRRVLDALDGLDAEVWSRPKVIGDRGMGGILVHQLGAAQRWRISLETQGEGEEPEPELEPLLSVEELRARWEAEWDAVDAWLPTLTQGFIEHVHEGVAIWQMLAHVVNHGTQHRSEAAALLTAQRRSPGELDMINYAEELAGQPE